jgi:hypothetical protein
MSCKRVFCGVGCREGDRGQGAQTIRVGWPRCPAWVARRGKLKPILTHPGQVCGAQDEHALGSRPRPIHLHQQLRLQTPGCFVFPIPTFAQHGVQLINEDYGGVPGGGDRKQSPNALQAHETRRIKVLTGRRRGEGEEAVRRAPPHPPWGVAHVTARHGQSSQCTTLALGYKSAPPSHPRPPTSTPEMTRTWPRMWHPTGPPPLSQSSSCPCPGAQTAGHPSPGTSGPQKGQGEG